MSNPRAALVGRLLAKTVCQELKDSPVSTDPHSSQPAVRLAGFEPDEVKATVSDIRDFRVHNHEMPIQVVVGSRSLPGLESHLLPEGETLAYYRNRNRHGLVLIELDEQSDAQSIQQMHSITDSDLLGRSAKHHLPERLRWLYEIAWSEHREKSGIDAPASLGQELDEIYKWLQDTSPPALRIWVDFVSATSKKLAQFDRAIAGSEVREVISAELGCLNLFPDRRLYERRQAGSRRLERNRHLSDLRNPQGRELRDDDLASRIDSTTFADDTGTRLTAPETANLRILMHEIRDNGGPSAERNVDLSFWDQLFDKKANATGLGALIRQHFEAVAPERAAELGDLQIEDGLDEGDAEAAEVLLTTEPNREERPLGDLLPPHLRKKVERLVFKGEQAAPDPLIAILNGLKALPSDLDVTDAPTVKLVWENARSDDEKGEDSAQLFAFLYGLTLLDLREVSTDNLGCTFAIDDRLLRTTSIDEVFKLIEKSELGEGPDDSDTAETWVPLQLSVRSSNANTPLIRFRWSPEDNPGLVLFARLVAAGGTGGQLRGPATDKWLARALRSQEPSFKPIDYEHIQGLGRRWRELATEHLSGMATNGVSAQRIGDYLDQWTPLLQEARDGLVPSGGPMVELDDVMTLETGATEDGHILMFGTHPLRLRWFGLHLERMAKYLRSALEGGLQLNSENDQLYFAWLNGVSPHRQPPLVTNRNKLYTAVREVGLHEEFAAIGSKSDGVPEWLDTLDSSSVDELVSTLKSFVSAFPQKTSGLSVLLLSHGGADLLAQRLVDRLRKRELADIDLELHIVTRAIDHDQVAATMAQFDSEEGRGTSLLPPFRLVLHEWQDDPSRFLEDLEGRIDVAIAPNIFGRHSTPLAETRGRESGVGGSYDPWVDRSTHTRPTATGSINVSQVLLPASPDPILEAWSTLSVRRHTSQPVAADDPRGTDFFTIQVQFDQSEQLFGALHRLAHWVVTLDPFIGRDQIDALSNAPDVITVRPGVGKNQMYTEVVSSTAGRRWVVERLRARLEDEFGIDPGRAERLAERIYEIGRQVVPGLLLRAMGLGRTVEEILGLILARYEIAEEIDHTNHDGGFEYWVSLDEHMEWFGGSNRLRPDLLRVQALRDGRTTRLRLLVLESKFRQKFDLGAADDQISRALVLFEEALGTSSTSERHDTAFWQRELLIAIDQLPHQAAAPSDLPAVRKLGEGVSEFEIRDDIRTGHYELEPIEGVVCATAWSSEAGNSPMSQTPNGHRVVVIDRPRALRILECIEAGSDPFVNAPSHLTDSDQPGGTPSAGGVTADEGSTMDSPGSPPNGSLAQWSSTPAPAAQPTGLGAGSDVASFEAKPIHADSEPVRAAHRMDPAILENRLQVILDRLEQLGVSVTRPEESPYLEGPGFCSYRVQPAMSVPAHTVTGKLEDLKLALKLPAEMSIRSFVDRGAVVFEVPKEDADRYFVDADDLLGRTVDDPSTLAVPVGEDAYGSPVSIDFSSSDSPHLLIAGTTGSGKSIVLETILRGLAARKTAEQLRFLLVDGKGTELVDFEDSPHLLGDIGYQPEDAIRALSGAVAEMNRRNGLFRTRRAKSLAQYNATVDDHDRLPWWLVVLDEYADLTSDPDERKQIEADLKRVAQKGRSAGIHLILATQKPSAEVLSTVVRSNLPAQLALRVKTSSDSRIILDESGAESLAGKGEAFFKSANALIRIQCAMVSS